MRPRSNTLSARPYGFPRVSGDAPRWHYTPAESEGFSPRERGCARVRIDYTMNGAVFPA